MEKPRMNSKEVDFAVSREEAPSSSSAFVVVVAAVAAAAASASASVAVVPFFHLPAFPAEY